MDGAALEARQAETDGTEGGCSGRRTRADIRGRVHGQPADVSRLPSRRGQRLLARRGASSAEGEKIIFSRITIKPRYPRCEVPKYYVKNLVYLFIHHSHPGTQSTRTSS